MSHLATYPKKLLIAPQITLEIDLAPFDGAFLVGMMGWNSDAPKPKFQYAYGENTIYFPDYQM